MEDFRSLKHRLRREQRRRLSGVSPEAFQRQDRHIAEHLGNFLRRYARTIPERFLMGGYAPLPGEANWWPTLAEEYGERVCFPGLRRGEMKFFACSLPQLVKTREFGVSLLAPPPQAPEAVPEVVLVPGLGFTRTGKRLGRGGGHYDRYLATYRGVSVGLAYREQLLDSLPWEAHDMAVDAVISADGIVSTRQ